MINEDKWESWTNEKMRFFDKWSICFFVRPPPYEDDQKVKNVKHLILIHVQNNSLMFPVLLKEYNLFSSNNESSLEK